MHVQCAQPIVSTNMSPILYHPVYYQGMSHREVKEPSGCIDLAQAILDRRSVRKYQDIVVDRELMKEIISLSRWAPSWANYQVVRYTIIDDKATILKLADDGVDGFIYNVKNLRNAKGVVVISFIEGKSGTLAGEYATSQKGVFEVFDAGLASQTFCLAAYSKGVATCIMGAVNAQSIAKIVKLPEEESVAALILYGYEDGKTVAPSRKDVDELVRFILPESK